MKKISTFNFFLLSSIVIIILFCIVGIFCFNSEITKLLLFYIIYFFITFLFVLKENKKIINIKTIFVAMYTLMIGISPLIYYFNNNTIISNTGNSIEYQFLMIIIGYISMVFGFYCFSRGSGDNLENNMNKTNYFSSKIKDNMNYVFSIMLIMLATFANIVYIFLNRELFFGGSLESSRITALSSNGLLLLLCGLNVIGIGFLYEYCVRNKKKYGILFFCIVITFVFYIIRGSRTAIFNIIFLIILLRNAYKPIKPKNMLKIVVIMIVLLGGLQIVRTIMSSGNANFFAEIFSSFQVGSINLNYVYLVFPDRVDFQYGYTFLINLKMLLPGSDPDFTLWLKDCIGISFAGGGVTPTLIGEGYINFGFLGIILFSFVVGLIAQKLNYLYFKNNYNKIWVCYLIVLFLSVFRSGIANIEVSLLSFIFIYVFYGLFVNNKRNCER